MGLVFISSPYGGQAQNIELARRFMRYAASQGLVPVAPHVMLHGVMDDANPQDRMTALAGCLELLDLCQSIWVCGNELTPGMARELEHARKMYYQVRPVSLADLKAWEHSSGVLP